MTINNLRTHDDAVSFQNTIKVKYYEQIIKQISSTIKTAKTNLSTHSDLTIADAK